MVELSEPTMLRAVIFICLQVLQSSCEEFVNYTALFGSSPRSGKIFPELADFDGRVATTHYVITCDGYILALHHIPPNPNCTTIHDLHILFMHGMYLCSDDCIVPGPNVAHGYIYSDACYHVWAGNNRGNKYSRNHTTLNPDTDEEFWNFNFDQMALYDTSAMIDFILKISNQTQILYIGHSQGMTNLIVLCSKIKEYNKKVKYAVGLSTATWLEYSRLLPIFVEAILSFFNQFSKYGEIFRHGGIVQKFADFLCGQSSASYPICTALICILFGYNNLTICEETIRVAISNEPAGTSIQNFFRWGMILKNGGFTEYDYGLLGNMEKYNCVKPPLYNLSNYTVETCFVSSCNDYVCDPRDLCTLIAHLINCEKCSKCILSNKYFCHIDYIYSSLIPQLIAPIVLALFGKGEHICT